MPLLVQALEATAAAEWRHRLWGRDHESAANAAKPKGHRLTKESYYGAVIEGLETDAPGTLPKWTDVIARVPNGARATFYSVAGPKAIHSLHREYAEGTDQQREIANRYTRNEAVARLIDEAKVWKYWMFREGWLHELSDHSELTQSRAAANLISVFVHWAATNKELAAALDHAPPMCAVEDLLLIFPQRHASAAAALLRKAVVLALGPLGTTADGVLDAVRPELEPSRIHRPSNERDVPTELVGRLAGALDALGHELRALPPDKADTTRQLVIGLLRDAIEDIGAPGGHGEEGPA